MKTKLTAFCFALITTQALANPNLPSPEQMMFDLTEEATCIAASQYLELDRQHVHRQNYAELVEEYAVPEEVQANIIQMTHQQYMHFIKRANKRYEKKILPSMLVSAYTHRCEFMNGFEARKEFNSEPPTI
ncbi:hypothetical protein [Vibrio agarivorans]|uniref:hypothetical protein n=1 Tax=Vibrio agarivorans TaxID=153622 RepID=UPI0025B31A30|nr:hypothetical protein [Vibrio agarivorans]MDN3659746.1 hypothetical protein [Vibrio agarivorans]